MEPVLGPFDLSGPMELWIQDGQDMHLSLRHDVDAGVVKKVILSNEATVTVRGAKAVVLRHPIELPFSSNATLSSLAHLLCHASLSRPNQPLISLRIVVPSSLAVSPVNTSTVNRPDGNTTPAPINRLKVKRLGPGQLQHSSPLSPVATETPTSSSPETAMVPIGVVAFHLVMHFFQGSNFFHIPFVLYRESKDGNLTMFFVWFIGQTSTVQLFVQTRRYDKRNCFILASSLRYEKYGMLWFGLVNKSTEPRLIFMASFTSSLTLATRYMKVVWTLNGAYSSTWLRGELIQCNKRSKLYDFISL